jgi:uncharacterized protein YraI
MADVLITSHSIVEWEDRMRLTFKRFDGRSWNFERIVDQDTGNSVGYVKSEGVGFAGDGGIDVSLFDGKYARTLNRYEECWGFVKGVEAVLNHMVSVPAQRTSDEKAAPGVS